MNELILVLTMVFTLTVFEVRAQQNSPTTKTQTSSEAAREDKENAEREYQKKLAEVKEKNEKIAETNGKISQALQEGIQAYNNKDYKLAIEKFDEAFILDPEFWGTAPVVLNNKALALRMIGTEKYNKALKSRLNPAFEANQYFLDAVSALKDAKKILDEAEIPNTEAAKTLSEKNRYISVNGLAECYKLLVLTDKTRIYEAIEAFENYIEIENDELLKQKAQDDLKNLKTQFNIKY